MAPTAVARVTRTYLQVQPKPCKQHLIGIFPNPVDARVETLFYEDTEVSS